MKEYICKEQWGWQYGDEKIKPNETVNLDEKEAELYIKEGIKLEPKEPEVHE